jgi:hypothetical protein
VELRLLEVIPLTASRGSARPASLSPRGDKTLYTSNNSVNNCCCQVMAVLRNRSTVLLRGPCDATMRNCVFCVCRAEECRNIIGESSVDRGGLLELSVKSQSRVWNILSESRVWSLELEFACALVIFKAVKLLELLWLKHENSSRLQRRGTSAVGSLEIATNQGLMKTWLQTLECVIVKCSSTV